jgi:methyl-accepting chemotaxis protein
VEQQATTAQQIAQNVHAAAGSAAHVAANIAEVNDGAGEITSASGQVLASAQTLSHDGSRLAAEMEKFLAAVCAA